MCIIAVQFLNNLFALFVRGLHETLLADRHALRGVCRYPGRGCGPFIKAQQVVLLSYSLQIRSEVHPPHIFFYYFEYFLSSLIRGAFNKNNIYANILVFQAKNGNYRILWLRVHDGASKFPRWLGKLFNKQQLRQSKRRFQKLKSWKSFEDQGNSVDSKEEKTSC